VLVSSARGSTRPPSKSVGQSHFNSSIHTVVPTGSLDLCTVSTEAPDALCNYRCESWYDSAGRSFGLAKSCLSVSPMGRPTAVFRGAIGCMNHFW